MGRSDLMFLKLFDSPENNEKDLSENDNFESEEKLVTEVVQTVVKEEEKKEVDLLKDVKLFNETT